MEHICIVSGIQCLFHQAHKVLMGTCQTALKALALSQCLFSQGWSSWDVQPTKQSSFSQWIEVCPSQQLFGLTPKSVRPPVDPLVRTIPTAYFMPMYTSLLAIWICISVGNLSCSAFWISSLSTATSTIDQIQIKSNLLSFCWLNNKTRRRFSRIKIKHTFQTNKQTSQWLINK